MTDIAKFYEFLNHKEYGKTELRIFDQNSKFVTRHYVSNVTDFERFCHDWNSKGHVYAGVNPRPSDEGTNESIKEITDIVFDIEYDHPKNTMITEEQLNYTLKKLDELFSYYNYDNLFAVMTGNGVQVHFKIKPTPKSDILKLTHKKYIEYIRSILPENIRIDMLCNEARIVRVPGTYNIKGGEKRKAYIWKTGTGRSVTFLNKFSELYREAQTDNTETPVEAVISQDSVKKMVDLLEKYPCYKTLFHRKASEGEHHFTAVRLIAFLKQEGFCDEEILEILLQWDVNNDQYEGRKMIQSLIWKQDKKLYNFGCQDDLLKRFCDSESCPIKQREDEYVPLVDMSKESESFIDVTASAPPEGAPELLHGFPSIDKRTWGLRRGELTVLAAYTSVGKTAAACQIASYNAKNKKKVLYVSSESKYNEIYSRMLAETFNIESFHFRNKHFTDNEREILKGAKAHTSEWALWICDEPCPTRLQVEQAIKQVKPDIIILDYIQRCNCHDDDSERKGLQEWMQHMKTMASRYNCAAIVLSQIRRRTEQDADPNLWDLFGSGALEMEGDNVILLHAKPSTNPFGMDEEKTVKWILAKGRNIGTGRFLFTYVGKYARFIECTTTGEMSAPTLGGNSETQN